jgi:hypothetical protein
LAEKKELTIGQIRKTFIAMMEQLGELTEKMPDELVRKAALVQLRILALHSADISDRHDLLDFCLSTVTTMKCSIDATLLPRDGRSIKEALGRLREEDHVNLSSIIFDKLQKIGT